MKQQEFFQRDLKLNKNNYSNLLFRDKADLNSQLLSRFPNAHFIGSMESMDILPKDEIELLSIKFSKVGKGVLQQLPNLKYVICRSHGTDNISPIVTKAGIIVKVAAPTAKAVADFIIDKMEVYNFEPPIVLFGYGSIGKLVATKLPMKPMIVSTKTTEVEIRLAVRLAKSAIITIPPGGKLLDDLIFANFEGKMLSVSRKSVFNLSALRRALDLNRLFFLSDTKEFLKSPNALFTGHVAWTYNLDWTDYIERIATTIDSCYE